mmetsp:Transcript_32485/g.92072  ORF Transcript_32485/g.92072 Transcript_32485/m.92072 type:complete len:254 (+) Transcript_32485:49-810(+)
MRVPLGRRGRGNRLEEAPLAGDARLVAGSAASAGRVKGDHVVDGELADAGHAGLGAIHLHREADLATQGAHGCQAALVVGATAPHKDLDLGCLQLLGHLPHGLDDPLEGGSDVCEVGNASSNDERTAPAVGVVGGALQHGAGILVRLACVGGPAVLAIVAQLCRKSQVPHRVGIDHAGAAAGHQVPHAALGVEDGELEGGAGGLVHLHHLGLVGCELLPKRPRKLQLPPLPGVLEARGVVQLPPHVERHRLPG